MQEKIKALNNSFSSKSGLSTIANLSVATAKMVYRGKALRFDFLFGLSFAWNLSTLVRQRTPFIFHKLKGRGFDPRLRRPLFPLTVRMFINSGLTKSPDMVFALRQAEGGTSNQDKESDKNGSRKFPS